MLFGGYTWPMLDIRNISALAITGCIIQQHVYHGVYKDIT